MKIEQVDINSITPYEKNPRKHPELQIREMKKSIEMFGQTRPIIVDENNVMLTGHCIRLASIEMGLKKVTITRIEGLSRSQKDKLILSDNKISELGADDYEAVMEMIKGLDDFVIPGFDSDILDQLINNVEKSINDYGTVNINELKTNNEEKFFDKKPEPEAPAVQQQEPLNESAPMVVISKSIKCPHCGGDVQL